MEPVLREKEKEKIRRKKNPHPVQHGRMCPFHCGDMNLWNINRNLIVAYSVIFILFFIYFFLFHVKIKHRFNRI